MDALELLTKLEQFEHHVPGFLRSEYDSLVNQVRQIYEAVSKYITPPHPLEDGKNKLSAYHTSTDDLHTKLNNSLPTFKLAYVGAGSDAYHTTAAQALDDLKDIRDHLAFASLAHQTMGNNFDIALTAQIALGVLLGSLAITLGVFFFSGGTTAPVTVPAAVIEAGGSVISIEAITTALATALASATALAEAALPYALTLGALAAGGILLSGDTPILTTAPATTIPLDWGNDAALTPWRTRIEQALKAKGLTPEQIALALARAAAVVKAMECQGFSKQEIDNLMSHWDQYYDPNDKVAWNNPPRDSFWYALAMLVKKETGFNLGGMSMPKNIDEGNLTGYIRVIRAVTALDGEDGNGSPVIPASISGGPLNVAEYGSSLFSDASGQHYLTQAEYNHLTDAEKAQWQSIKGDVDIVTIDGKHIEVGGANKVSSIERQVQMLKKLPGGASTAYVFLEEPPDGSPQSMQDNFALAVSKAKNALGDPSHVIIIKARSNSCTSPTTP